MYLFISTCTLAILFYLFYVFSKYNITEGTCNEMNPGNLNICMQVFI